MTKAKHTPEPWEAGKETLYDEPQEGTERRRIRDAAPVLLESLELAEGFISGFEDDETQEGMEELLATIRGAISLAKGDSDENQDH